MLNRKYPYSPQKGLDFPGGWGFCKAKECKEMYEALSGTMMKIASFLLKPF